MESGSHICQLSGIPLSCSWRTYAMPGILLEWTTYKASPFIHILPLQILLFGLVLILGYTQLHSVTQVLLLAR